MRPVAVLTLICLVLVGLPSSGRADVRADCKSPAGRELAITACTKVLQRGGLSARDRATAYSYRGFAHMIMWQVDEALADANRAIEADQRYDGGYYVRGLVYSRQGKFDLALKDLNRGIVNNPASAPSYATRCLVYLFREEPDRAIADCNRAIEINPKYSAAYNNRGLYHTIRREYDRALPDYGRAIELSPKSTTAFSNRGRTFMEMGQVDRGMADLERSIELDPRNPFAYRTRSSVYIKKGQQERGFADLMRAIELDPHYAEAYVDRGEIYLKKNQTGSAIADFRKALSLPARQLRERDAQIRAATLLTSLTQNTEPVNPPIPAVTSGAAPVPNLAPAPALGGSGRRVALLIGNSTYANAGVLKNPRNDARILAETLRRIGFSDVVEHYDLGLASMTDALKTFGDQSANADWAVIYFSGHGLEMDGISYLVPIDAKLERDTHIPDETVPVERILQKAAGARALRLVIVDACRNNPFATRMVRTGNATRSIGRGLAPIEPEGDVLVAYATKHGTTALDGEGSNSPYALALAQHVPVPNIDIRVMFGRVRDTVRKTTNSQQEPYTYGSIGGDLRFFVTSAR
jgi:tetratricopeptide (TPR) repeat protein